MEWTGFTGTLLNIFLHEIVRQYIYFGGHAVFHGKCGLQHAFYHGINHQDGGRYTPDKSGLDGCIMLGVFYCSKKGQAVLWNSPARLFSGRRRQAAGEAGTEYCPHERGRHECGTGWK